MVSCIAYHLPHNPHGSSIFPSRTTYFLALLSMRKGTNKSLMLALWDRTWICLRTEILRRLALGVSVCLADKKLGMGTVSVYSIELLTYKLSVALARAVYARTKYILLDDPLSAVVCTLPNSVLRVIS